MVVWELFLEVFPALCQNFFSLLSQTNLYNVLSITYFLSLLSFFELFLSFFFFLSFSFLTLAFYMYICVPFSSLSWPPRAWPKGGGTVMTHDRVTVTCHTFVTF